MNELGTELDTELRALDIAPAPVAAAMRAGRRLRHRRFGAAVGVIAVAAIAAGVPALTRLGAAPAPRLVTRPVHRDPVVTDIPPGKGAPAGEVAHGTVGRLTWRFTFSKPVAGVPASDYCVDVTGTVFDAESPALSCVPLPDAATIGITRAGGGFSSQSAGSMEATIGSAAPDVAYLVLTFADGQHIKLTPVAEDGYRLVAWVAPASMTIARVTARYGNGQTSTAIPLSLPGELPFFGLWQSPGQTAPPRATRVLASGTSDGQPFPLTAYEGPWGTCFVSASPAGGITSACEQEARLATTELIGVLRGSPSQPGSPAEAAVFGSAAPGVASVAVKLSDGKTVTAVPVTVGNERLFAFLIGSGVSPTRWTAYSATGKVIRAGSVPA